MAARYPQDDETSERNQVSWSQRLRESVPDPVWIVFHLVTDGPGISPTMTAAEIGKLLFRRLGFPTQGVVQMVDPSAFKMLKVKVVGDFDIAPYLNAAAIEIRPGLKVLPMKEMREPKWVKIMRVPAEVHATVIKDVLAMFGKVLSDPEFIPLELRKEEAYDEYAQLMTWICRSCLVDKNSCISGKTGEKELRINHVC